MIQILDKKDCCGCAACMNVCPTQCIKMQPDEEGFLYPEVQIDQCIHCGKCEKVCPIGNDKNHRDKTFSKMGFIVQNLDKKVCWESTSGGLFSAIAGYVIENDGVVFGAGFNKGFEVCHYPVETLKELRRFRNSKYVQSRIGSSYRTVKAELEKGRLVCFSGTPCQIEGIRAFLGKEYENLILVDIVCRAVPSPGIWKRYLDMESKKIGAISKVRFRDKKRGYQFSTMYLQGQNGKSLRGGIESQPWLRMYFSGMIIRPSCTTCKFRSEDRNSDFTIWDCFPSRRFDKSFNEDIGTSRVLIHTPKGKALFDQISNGLRATRIPTDLLVQGVNEMVKSPEFDRRRVKFFHDYHVMDFTDLVQKYYPQTLSVRIKKYTRILLNSVGLDKIVKRVVKK